MSEPRSRALLSAQRALAGAVTANMRGVCVSSEGPFVRLRVYFDREPSEDDREAATEAETEMLADFTDKKVRLETLTVAAPAPLDVLGDWVFRRRE